MSKKEKKIIMIKFGERLQKNQGYVNCRKNCGKDRGKDCE